MRSPFEFETITEERDRSATFLLLERLADPLVDDEERGEVAYALGALADPRSFRPLMELAKNRAVGQDLRRTAMSVFFFAGLTPEGEILCRWWADGDEFLRRETLLCTGRTEMDVVGPVAKDPSHPFHEEAIRGISSEFDEPEWQECKIAALSHPSIAVREAAASSLLWHEPIRAETALHRAASDADLGVAVAAIETLQYYSSLSDFFYVWLRRSLKSVHPDVFSTLC